MHAQPAPAPRCIPWHALPRTACSRERVIKFTNAQVYLDGRLAPGDLWVRDGRIIDPARRFWEAVTFLESSCDLVVDCEGHVLSPGFVDLQFNGGYGTDFSSAATSEADILGVATRLLQTGVTSLLPTLVSSAADAYRAILPRFLRLRERLEGASAALVRSRAGSEAGGGGAAAAAAASQLAPAAAPPLPRAAARLLGLHLEGPFLCREKKGAHTLGALRDPLPHARSAAPEDAADAAAGTAYASTLAALQRVYGPVDWGSGEVRLVTLAPELHGGLEACRALADAGVLVSLGHTSANIDVADAAVEAGAALITHLFNAMNAFQHREPGVVGLLGRRPRGARSLGLVAGHWEASKLGSSSSGGGGDGNAAVLLPSPLPAPAAARGGGQSVIMAAASLKLATAGMVTAYSQVPFPGPGSRSHAVEAAGAGSAGAGGAGGGATAAALAAAAAAAAAGGSGSSGGGSFGGGGGGGGNSTSAASFYSLAQAGAAPRPRPQHQQQQPKPSGQSPEQHSSRSAAHSPELLPAGAGAGVGVGAGAQPSEGGFSLRPSAAVTAAEVARGGVAVEPMGSCTPHTPQGSTVRAAVLVNAARAAADEGFGAPRALNFSGGAGGGEGGEAAGGAPPPALPPPASPAPRPYARPCASVVAQGDAAQRAVAACRPFYSLIADGVHVHPYAVSLAYDTHPAGLVLVTDAMAALGLPEGTHLLGEQHVRVLEGGKEGSGGGGAVGYAGRHAVLAGSDGAPLVDGGTRRHVLAGAIVPLDECLNNFMAFTGAGVEEALAGVTSHPAAALGLGGGQPLGSLRCGAWADLVLLRHTRAGGGGGGRGTPHLQVLQTWVGGTLGYTLGEQLRVGEGGSVHWEAPAAGGAGRA